ncbi:MAG: hypothetical protein H6741_04075 [Alphaproteobacteria bacterium]|nr:hypothetical protein [Alphaproteobacteria bacterium]
MSKHIETVFTAGMPTGDEVGVVRRRYQGEAGRRVAIVAGIRGTRPRASASRTASPPS